MSVTPAMRCNQSRLGYVITQVDSVEIPQIQRFSELPVFQESWWLSLNCTHNSETCNCGLILGVGNFCWPTEPAFNINKGHGGSLAVLVGMSA